MVVINCAALPETLLESELFGHEKGSFTGAIAAKPGLFEVADGGTLFIDEIGDMSVDMQVKLLRVLQERAFERVGSGEQRRANVRIVAATHRDLEARSRTGEFREDLFFRLNVFPIAVPPLRERVDDLPALIDDLVRRGEAEGRPSITFTQTALDCMSAYDWPGNVRELQNLIERLAILHPNKTVDREHLPPPIGERRRNAQPAITSIPTTGLDLREHLGDIEKQLIRSALDLADGTVAHAARLLNLRRTTLVEKLRKYELQAQAQA
jgi:sigma-54 specific flagellar transcriptional regulator A